MGNSQSTNDTDTTQLVLESDDEGKTKVTKRRLSREELDDLTEQLKKVTDNSVTIDTEIYKSIAADLGITLEEDLEEEEEEEEEYYDEIEPYELIEPIQTPDNFDMILSMNDLSSVGPIELYPPPFIPRLQTGILPVTPTPVVEEGPAEEPTMTGETKLPVIEPQTETVSELELSESELELSESELELPESEESGVPSESEEIVVTPEAETVQEPVVTVEEPAESDSDVEVESNQDVKPEELKVPLESVVYESQGLTELTESELELSESKLELSESELELPESEESGVPSESEEIVVTPEIIDKEPVNDFPEDMKIPEAETVQEPVVTVEEPAESDSDAEVESDQNVKSEELKVPLESVVYESQGLTELTESELELPESEDSGVPSESEEIVVTPEAETVQEPVVTVEEPAESDSDAEVESNQDIKSEELKVPLKSVVYESPEAEPVPEDEAVQQEVIVESPPEPEPAAVEEPQVEEPAKEELVVEEAVSVIEQKEVVEPIEEPVLAEPAVPVVEEPTIAPVVVEDVVAEIPALVEEPTPEVVAAKEESTIPETESHPASETAASHSGLFSLIQNAIEPYFTSSNEVQAPTTIDVTPESESVTVISEPESVATPVEPVATEPVEPTVTELQPTAPSPPLEQVTRITKNELPHSETLAQSLFGEFKKQELEKIMTEAKLEGARGQAKLDADVMSSALNAERSRWRKRFSVIESNLQKRKRDISSAHEEGVALVTSKVEIPKTQEVCTENVSEIVDCYRAHPDQVLRCNQLAQSFNSCVSNVLSSR